MLLLPALLLVSQPRNRCQIWHFSAMFSLRNSVVFALAFRPLIHFELIFVCGTGEGLTSFFSMWTSSFLKSICRRLLPPPNTEWSWHLCQNRLICTDRHEGLFLGSLFFTTCVYAGTSNYASIFITIVL